MPSYDKATEDFMTKFSGETLPAKEEQKPEENSLSLNPLRTVRQIVKGVDDPRKALAKVLVRAATNQIMDKAGSIKILMLYQLMNDKHGREWWDWEPETIWHMIEADHIEGQTPEETKNVIMALQLTLNSMAPFEHWHIFEKVGHAFNWNPVSFEIVQPLEPDEACLAMVLLSRIQRKAVFEDEVLTYVAVCAKSGGVAYLPPELAPGVQDKLNEITFEYHLRDATKKAWESSTQPKADDPLRDQVEIQLHRLNDIKDLLSREV